MQENLLTENSYRLVSLRDIMEIIKASGFVNHGNNLRLCMAPSGVFREYPIHFNPESECVKGEAKDLIVKCLISLKRDCEVIGLVVTLPKVNRIIQQIQSGKVTFTALEKTCEDVLERLEDELASHLFLMVDSRNVAYYNNFETDWDIVVKQFPSTERDIEESSKCVALNRSTACVFHLMKILEVGLYSLANDLDIAKIEDNWNNAIEQIEKAIKDFEKNNPGKTTLDQERDKWKAKLQFYSDCATHFRYIKDAWRNQTTHTRKGATPYTEEKSKQIYDNVRGFMQTMATKLQEKP